MTLRTPRSGDVDCRKAAGPPPYPPPRGGEGREGARAAAREALMTRRNGSIRIVRLAGSMLAAAIPATAAEVTPQRLLNPDKEPQNWLMNHRSYDGQRFSPLARINRDTVKNLKLAYAVPLGGGAGNGFANATPLAEDGFPYVTDAWDGLS